MRHVQAINRTSRLKSWCFRKISFRLTFMWLALLLNKLLCANSYTPPPPNKKNSSSLPRCLIISYDPREQADYTEKFKIAANSNCNWWCSRYQINLDVFYLALLCSIFKVRFIESVMTMKKGSTDFSIKTIVCNKWFNCRAGYWPILNSWRFKSWLQIKK